MEQNQANYPQTCRAGCGFFGSPATDGLCSKCFKDNLKKTNDPPGGIMSPPALGKLDTRFSRPSVSASISDNFGDLQNSKVVSSNSPTVVTTPQPDAPRVSDKSSPPPQSSEPSLNTPHTPMVIDSTPDSCPPIAATGSAMSTPSPMVMEQSVAEESSTLGSLPDGDDETIAAGKSSDSDMVGVEEDYGTGEDNKSDSVHQHSPASTSENQNTLLSSPADCPSSSSSSTPPVPGITISGAGGGGTSFGTDIDFVDAAEAGDEKMIDNSNSSPAGGGSTSVTPDASPRETAEDSDEGGHAQSSASGGQQQPVKRKSNRCDICRKKTGLTGFECRCGGLYCGSHRYSNEHQCTFDYKALGAEEIRKNNPVIQTEKIQKL